VLATYAELLGQAAEERGLLGPREVPRIWERHLLNCAVVGELIPHAATVVDIGSGPGLPGIPLAIVRSDCRVILLEPTQRRVDFLREVVDACGLTPRVVVDRGRAEERAGWLRATVATGRAVAPLRRFATMALPLLASDGEVLAIRGKSAEEEISEARRDFARRGVAADLLTVGEGVVDPPTTVVRMRRVEQRRGTAAGWRAGRLQGRHSGVSRETSPREG